MDHLPNRNSARREEREYMKKIDAMLDHWEATQAEHDAEVARVAAEDLASGATARMIALGEAAHNRAWAFEDARRRKRS